MLPLFSEFLAKLKAVVGKLLIFEALFQPLCTWKVIVYTVFNDTCVMTHT